jgi:GNAT superfamily N-acetyltransferase
MGSSYSQTSRIAEAEIGGIMAAMIRAATPADVPAILALIRELAEYEHLTDACVATEALLERHLFGEDRAGHAIVAEEEGAVVGYAIYFTTFSTFLARPGIYLEDLYVQPAHRRRGVGRALLRRVARIAVERGCGRLEWSVLDWNAPSISFYRKLGAVPLDEWTMMRLAGEALTDFAAG